MITFFEKLKQLLSLKQAESTTTQVGNTAVAAVTADNIHRLAHLLTLTDLDACTCHEAYELLDEYVDLVDNNEEAEALMPIVKHHLDRCPNCRGLYEDLLQALHDK
jgi:hypothetical protein